MAHGELGTVIAYLRRIVRRPADNADGDRQLLQRFAAQQDQDAFGELVRRHGPMVFNVCRRLLNDEHAAEDAFQAVFLVLARKARSLSWHESVAGWLHEVARRTATKARALTARRLGLERQAPQMTSTDSVAETNRRELREVLDEELSRLPEKYRAPLVLCYLEGRTNEEAARQLGWTKGTVSGRLARARDLLRSRLDRRGLGLSAAALAAALERRTAEAALSSALCASTIQAAVHFAAGNLATAGSGPAVMLAEGVLATMALSRLKLVTVLILILLLAVGGAGALTYHTRNGASPAPIHGPEQWADQGQTSDQEVEVKKGAEAAELADFGAEVHGLRARVKLRRSQFRVGEPIEVSYGVKNVSKQDQVIERISGYWPFDRILVTDAAGKKVPLTPQAQAALTALSPPRGPFAPPPGKEKNLLGQLTLKPGDENGTKAHYDLTKVYDLSNPGRYKVQYIYRLGGLGEGEVPSNELAFDIVAK